MPGDAGSKRYSHPMLIVDARVSTSGQVLAAQRDGLAALGGDDQHVHVDHGPSGTTRARPGLREALAACRAGDVLVVTKLDLLARSLQDATDIADELTKKGVAQNLGGAVYDPTDPVGRLLFNVLGMVAEFEAEDDLPHERIAFSSEGQSASSFGTPFRVKTERLSR
jgi:DNA invertase Pin-like site-specific DNA recombinase